MTCYPSADDRLGLSLHRASDVVHTRRADVNRDRLTFATGGEFNKFLAALTRFGTDEPPSVDYPAPFQLLIGAVVAMDERTHSTVLADGSDCVAAISDLSGLRAKLPETTLPLTPSLSGASLSPFARDARRMPRMRASARAAGSPLNPKLLGGVLTADRSSHLGGAPMAAVQHTPKADGIARRLRSDVSSTLVPPPTAAADAGVTGEPAATDADVTGKATKMDDAPSKVKQEIPPAFAGPDPTPHEIGSLCYYTKPSTQRKVTIVSYTTDPLRYVCSYAGRTLRNTEHQYLMLVPGGSPAEQAVEADKKRAKDEEEAAKAEAKAEAEAAKAEAKQAREQLKAAQAAAATEKAAAAAVAAELKAEEKLAKDVEKAARKAEREVDQAKMARQALEVQLKLAKEKAEQEVIEQEKLKAQLAQLQADAVATAAAKAAAATAAKAAAATAPNTVNPVNPGAGGTAGTSKLTAGAHSRSRSRSGSGSGSRSSSSSSSRSSHNDVDHERIFLMQRQRDREYAQLQDEAALLRAAKRKRKGKKKHKKHKHKKAKR